MDARRRGKGRHGGLREPPGGRPPRVEDGARVTLYLSGEVREGIDALAKARGVSRSEMTDVLLRRGLSRTKR